MATKAKKAPKIKLEIARWQNDYQITKMVHASRIPLTDGQDLRCGTKFYGHEILDALAEECDVTVTLAKNIL